MNFLLMMFLSMAEARTPLYQAKPQVEAAPTAVQPNHKTKQDGLSWNDVVRGNPIIVPAKEVTAGLESLKPGEVVFGEIGMSLLAFSDSKSPVTARAIDPSGRELVFTGEARLEKNSKRIFIDFRKVRLGHSNTVFDVKANALDLDRIQGIEGEYVSGEGTILGSEFLASAAAGFADASINRSTNVLGNQVEENSLDTRTKKAAGSALSKTAERLAEKARQAPEYAKLIGPVPIQILIEEEPKRKL